MANPRTRPPRRTRRRRLCCAATSRICAGTCLRALTPAASLVVADLPVIGVRDLIRSGGMHRDFGSGDGYRELERENMRLRKAVADLTLDKRQHRSTLR